jgi:hypothetical protein
VTAAPRSAYGISVIEYFERWKQQCEEDLRFAESQPGFKLIRRTDNDRDVDVTEEHSGSCVQVQSSRYAAGTSLIAHLRVVGMPARHSGCSLSEL